MKKIVLLASAIALIACGKEEAKKEAPKAAPAKEEAKPAPAAPAAEAAVVEIKVEANDAMQYNTAEIKAKAGSKVKLTLTHTGKMPKTAMGHNLVILKAGEDLNAFAQAASAAGPEKDYLHDASKTIAATKVIGGGESVTIEFDAPAAGTYEYLCTFPGHFAIMKGKLIVE